MCSTRRPLALLGLAALALGVTGCAAPDQPPEPETLTPTRAAVVYLDAVCPVNEAWDEADVELDRLRLAAERGMTASTSTFAASMIEVAERSASAATALTSGERTWPDAARDPIASVAETLEADEAQAKRVASLPAADVVDYRWEGAEDIGAAAAEARGALQLPADADAACAAWRESGDDAGDDDDAGDGGEAQ